MEYRQFAAKKERVCCIIRLHEYILKICKIWRKKRILTYLCANFGNTNAKNGRYAQEFDAKFVYAKWDLFAKVVACVC